MTVLLPILIEYDPLSCMNSPHLWKRKRAGPKSRPYLCVKMPWHLRAGYLFFWSWGITPSAAAILKKWKGSVAVLYT